MTSLDVAIVGAGQAALALAQFLSKRPLRYRCITADERVGDCWRRRFDSLRLFTPAQYDNLPGLPFPAPTDHYPGKDEVADYLESYAAHFNIEVELATRVTRISHDGEFILTTTRGEVRARQVVLAMGSYGEPHTPEFAARLAPTVAQVHAAHYHDPRSLPPGPVVVVGGGASGVQIAAELAATRSVTLCRGEPEVVLPQRIFGRDIWYWLERTPDVSADSWIGRRLSRSDPLVGEGPGGLSRRLGIFLRSARVIDATDDHLLLADDERLPVHNLVWATGYRHRLDWIDLPITDARGAPIHRGGVSPVPGLYFLGLRWMRSRGSSLLGWVGRDAEHIADLLSR